MSEIKISLTEMFAERISELDMLDSTNRSESFAEMLGETLVENLPENVELTDDEWRKLQVYLQDFVEEELEDEAVGMVHEWNEDARESYFEREEARRGQY